MGWFVVSLGLAALGFVVFEAVLTPVSGPADQDTGQDHAVAVGWLIAWAAVVGGAALAILMRGLGELVMTRREARGDQPPDDPIREIAAMNDAEVNKVQRSSPVPCDSTADFRPHHEQRQSLSLQPPKIEVCPAPDRIIHLPLGAAVGTATSATLMKSAGIELIRLVIPGGTRIPPHRAPGEITVLCIEGQVAFEHDGGQVDMRPGDLLHLCPREIHALRGIVDSSVLVTRLRPPGDEIPEALPTP